MIFKRSSFLPYVRRGGTASTLNTSKRGVQPRIFDTRALSGTYDRRGGVFGYRVSGERGRYPPNKLFSARFLQEFMQISVILDYILTVSEKKNKKS